MGFRPHCSIFILQGMEHSNLELNEGYTFYSFSLWSTFSFQPPKIPPKIVPPPGTGLLRFSVL